jgi:hypothetical protein
MDVLFSTLIDVFVNVLSTSMLISDVLAFDSCSEIGVNSILYTLR